MSKYKTQWGLYYIGKARDFGFSLFFDTFSEAVEYKNCKAPWTGSCFIVEQTYELED